MSTANVPAVAERAPVPASGAGLPEFRRQQLYREAQVIAGTNLVRSDLRKRPDDVFAIACTLATMGVEPTLYTVNQCFCVNGVVGIMGQLLIGVADQRGYDLDILERTPEQASVVLRRRSDGRETTMTYTMAEAGKSATGGAWTNFPVDMLVWRAVRRAMRFGAPSIVAGLPADEQIDAATWEPPAEPGADHELGGSYAALPTANEVERRRIDRLTNQIGRLPEPVRKDLGLAWADRNLPPLTHPDLPGRIDEAEDLLDEITARALKGDTCETTVVAAAAPVGAPSGATSSTGASIAGSTSSARPAGPETARTSPSSGETAPARSADDRARPLAQAIAMAAQEIGVDHHHLLSAVTCGEVESAKAVKPGSEEAELYFKAIEALKAGEVALAEKDGRWVLDDSGRAFE